MDNERRAYPSELRVLPKDANGEVRITAHAAVFNSESENLGNFVEIIDSAAFDADLRTHPDVKCLREHDPSLILGRTTAGTLELNTDSRGLKYTVRLPQTSYAADLIESVNRRDLTASSFAFVCHEDRWTKRSDGVDVRRVMRAALRDVSIVGSPAYPAANDVAVAQRSLQFHTRSGPFRSSMAYYRERLRRLEESQEQMERALDNRY